MTRAKRGFAQVTQQRSGRYAVRYCLPNGQRVSAGKTFVRKADAEAWAADRRREIARGKARGGLAGKRLACADALAVRQAVAHRVPAGFLLGDLRETTLGAHGMVALEMHRKP